MPYLNPLRYRAGAYWTGKQQRTLKEDVISLTVYILHLSWGEVGVKLLCVRVCCRPPRTLKVGGNAVIGTCTVHAAPFRTRDTSVIDSGESVLQCHGH